MNGNLTHSERVFLLVNDIIMILLCLVMIYPVLFVAGRSVTPDIERALHPLRIIPATFDFSGYSFIFSSGSNIGLSVKTPL